MVANQWITVGEEEYLRGCGLNVMPVTSIGERGVADLVQLDVYAGDDVFTGALYRFMFPKEAAAQLAERLVGLDWSEIGGDNE